ncbi:MAG TPA: methyltransferase domain-containing protein [Arenibaculum sp.]|nr:methyltransferase domain-containing protein [Arenibaculum sp.]
MIGPTGRLAYTLGQTARISWFLGQYAVAARIGRTAGTGGDRPARARPAGGSGQRSGQRSGLGGVVRELRELMLRDLANIEAGYYRPPFGVAPSAGRMLADAASFFRDLPEVGRRRMSRAGSEVRRMPPPAAAGLPAYYLQNFHYQTDGYLSDRSARLYDHQVEVLFGGGADAMRRHALVPIHHFLRERGVAGKHLLDVGAGTGRFLTFVKDNYPRLDVTAVDLSAPYLAEARRRLAPWRGVRLVQAAAEALPLAEAGVDVVTSIYLFHELPRPVRAAAAAEMARVLRPGGLLVLADSIQPGDRPHFDRMLELFPASFHEPYYADYLRQDIGAPFVEAGLEPVGTDIAFLTKIMVFRKRT